MALQIAQTDKQGEGTDRADPLVVIAAAVANLSPADRAKLATMLTGHQGEGKGRKAEREAGSGEP
ncbi:MAG: hypothetical protein WCB27_14720 [Thermoguttaceae bacterium]